MEPKAVDDMTLDLMPDEELLAVLITELAAPATYSESAIEMAMDELKERISERAFSKRDQLDMEGLFDEGF